MKQLYDISKQFINGFDDEIVGFECFRSKSGSSDHLFLRTVPGSPRQHLRIQALSNGQVMAALVSSVGRGRYEKIWSYQGKVAAVRVQLGELLFERMDARKSQAKAESTSSDAKGKWLGLILTTLVVVACLTGVVAGVYGLANRESESVIDSMLNLAVGCLVIIVAAIAGAELKRLRRWIRPSNKDRKIGGQSFQ